ncbi:MAG: hypothetical protein OES20_16970 [Gammaproteobacteria bacterium]|nr:hypothetical protein [Gammaproteobacteria bacterium]MDH3858557.1 hypothetical protein [Gammaproteobacteria bacterium]
MASKRKTAKKPNSNQINVYVQPDENQGMGLARGVLRPSVQAAVTLKAYDNAFGDIELNCLIDSLVEQTKASNDGDMSRAEAMLTTQAHTLDAIFNNLASRAIKAEYMNNLDIYLKLALRAQSQCRATWEALSAIKNPPIMGYVGQANIAQGPQQVNNTPDTPRARKNQNQQNKQLEQKDGERLDTRATGTTGEADPAMAALGEIDGAENQSR